MAVLIIILLVCLIGFFAIRYWWINRQLLNRFKDNNVIVFGRKGKGKDLLFQWVINKRKREEYFANITYGHKYHNVKVEDISLAPNTYQNLIEGKVIQLDKQPFPDKCDIYISDGGNYLPSQYDTLLHKQYKGSPIYYATSRHISLNNIHINTQNLERVWKALREQADTYIWIRKKTKFPFFIRIDYVMYDKYESARQELLPIAPTLRSRVKDQKIILASQNGMVKGFHIWIRKKSIHYDTRAFRKIFIKESAATPKE